MNETDRHIVTFDDDDYEYDYSAGVPQDVEPEVRPYGAPQAQPEFSRKSAAGGAVGAAETADSHAWTQPEVSAAGAGTGFVFSNEQGGADQASAQAKDMGADQDSGTGAGSSCLADADGAGTGYSVQDYEAARVSGTGDTYESHEHFAPQSPVTEEEAEYLTERDRIYGMDDSTGETWRYRDEHLDPARGTAAADGAPAGTFGQDFSTSAAAPEAPDTSDSAQTGSIDADIAIDSEPQTYDFGGGGGSNPPGGRHSATSGGPRYVTRGMLAICLVITMLVSSVLGALIGSSFSKGSTPSGQTEISDEQGEHSQKSLSEATNSELTIAEIVNKNEDAVVEILVSGTTQNFFGQSQVTEGAGSGVIINSNGYIVTNYHVIEGANKVQVTLHNGDTYPATIVGGDNDNDIAVIKINATDLTVAEIGDSDSVVVGDTAVAIGNPLGQLGGTATTGIISALDRKLSIDGRTLSLLQTDAAINGGNSGGGLFNSRGQLIGIVDAKSSGVGIEGLAFAIPINSVKDIINDLVETGKVSAKPAIGIMIQDVSEDNAQYYNLEAAGVYVAQVTGENAQKAGFMQGDRIISFNGEEIENGQDLISKVRKCKVGDNVSIVISRSGQEMEIRTVLEETTATE